MFDLFRGLPMHIIVVHAVVVLVPLSALGLVGMAVVPAWRARFGAVVALGGTVALVSILVATRSGRELKARIGSTPAIEHHQRLGDTMVWFFLPMWLLTIGLLYLDRRVARSSARAGVGSGDGPGTATAVRRAWTGQSTLTRVVAVLSVLAALVATAQVMRVGEAGSKAVWKPIVDSTGN